MIDSKRKIEAVYRAIRREYARKWWRASDVVKTANRSGHPALRAAVYAVIDAKASEKSFAKWASRHRDVSIASFTLVGKYDSCAKTWKYQIAHSRDKPEPVKLPPEPKPAALPRPPRGPTPLPPELYHLEPDEAEIQKISRAAQQAGRNRSDLEARIAEHNAKEAEKAARLASDPAPSECWCGPYLNRADAERSAALIKKCALGAGSTVVEIGSEWFAHSINVENATRIADGLRRMYRLNARVGLHGAIPSRGELVQQSVTRAAEWLELRQVRGQPVNPLGK